MKLCLSPRMRSRRGWSTGLDSRQLFLQEAAIAASAWMHEYAARTKPAIVGPVGCADR
jgi:hypothetical protein